MTDKEKFYYSLHAQSRQFGKRIEHAQRIAHDGFDAMKTPYASLSFGKDSTVMVDLLTQMRPDLPVLYVDCGKWDEWPDTPRVKFELLKKLPLKIETLTGPSIMEAYKKSGVYIQDEENSELSRKAQKWYGDSLGDVLDDTARKRGYDGAFIGCRREESKIRAWLFAAHGPLYFAKSRQLWACHPLAFWSGKDIWAYIVSRDLPYNELYDLAPEGRELARNGAMFGTRSARYGRVVFLKRMYPDWFNEFAGHLPEIRSMT